MRKRLLCLETVFTEVCECSVDITGRQEKIEVFSVSRNPGVDRESVRATDEKRNARFLQRTNRAAIKGLCCRVQFRGRLSAAHAILT